MFFTPLRLLAHAPAYYDLASLSFPDGAVKRALEQVEQRHNQSQALGLKEENGSRRKVKKKKMTA